MKKVAIITTHPIQYYAPWFRRLAQEPDFAVKVFYLWNFGVTEQRDVGFEQTIKWDVPLLDGYDYEFVPNTSRAPGTHHFRGLQNPALYERVKAYSPDAVLSIGYNYASLQSFIMRWRRTPLLFRGDSHRLVARHGFKEVARRTTLSLLFRRFAAFLYVGEANRGYFRYHRVPERKLFFAPHAVDNDRFFGESERALQQAERWKREIGIPTDHSVILFAGKFEEKKCPADLLQAFVQANLARTSLLFVGGGALESELKSWAARQPRIFFAPFQNQSMMPRTYATGDLLVLPSRGASETWGLAVNEAMCMSRAVIASNNVGCVQDLVHENRNGLIFPAGDVQSLATKLADALSDSARLRQWGEESRRIVSRYSYARGVQGLRESLAGIGV